MSKKEKRFIVTEKEGNAIARSFEVIVDKETGVNYLWVAQGNAGGLTPLLDKEGRPVITPVIPEE